MDRRDVLKWLGGGLSMTFTPSFVRAADMTTPSTGFVCNRQDKPDSIPNHPYNLNADIPVRLSELAVQKNPNAKRLSDAEIASIREKDCLTCSRVLERQRSELVWYNDGNLPVLIAVPHGGTELVLEVSPRQNRDKAEQFSIYGAIYTEEIAYMIRYVLEDRFEMRPYMVTCLAHRRYVDVNRDYQNAYVMGQPSGLRGNLDDDAKSILNTLSTRYRKSGAPIFFEYHCAMERYVNSLYNRYDGRALLIEITGGSTFPNQILRNTLEGSAVQRLRQQSGDDALIGENSLMGKISKKGYEVDPVLGLAYPPKECLNAVTTSDACRVETNDFGGNYTLSQYGSQNPRGIDAIQINIGQDLRTTSNYERTGQDLGNAIADFLEGYYGIKKRDY